MIVKSMSRKVPSFGQLIGYIDRDEGQEPYRIRHNVWGRNPDLIRAEFEQNGDLLAKRKNGVYLYHEIISITRAKGLSPDEQMARLHDIAETYIAARCPDNLVFGGLHQDKDHSYHYHLMISANRAGDTGRLRLTKAQFREVQVGLERHVLETYPELEQKVAIDKRSDRGRKKGEAELERRTGARPKREEVLERVLAAYGASQDRQSLLDALGREGLELYVRGKTLGVVDLESGKKHRLRTLDLEMADQVAIRMEAGEAQEELEPEVLKPKPAEAQVEPEAKVTPEGEKEKADEREVEEKAEVRRRKRERSGKQETAPDKSTKRNRKRDDVEKNTHEADNSSYVKYDRNADLKRDPSKQKKQKRKVPHQEKEEEMQRNAHSGDPVEPSPERQELIDKGHVKPDPDRDLMSHEEWHEQDTFLGKMKQSWRRTFDDFRGRTKDLEEKALGKERGKEPIRPEPKAEQTKPAQQRSADKNQVRSAQQEKWRSEMSRNREAGRDDPEQGRE